MTRYTSLLILFIVFSVLLLASCKKEKMQQCIGSRGFREARVSFIGFSQAELDTIVLTRSHIGSTTGTIPDTIIQDSIVFRGDTAYAVLVGHPFFVFPKDFTYSIELLSNGKQFLLENLRYPSEAYTDLVYEASSCLPRTAVADPISATVNGDTVATQAGPLIGRYIYLGR